MNQIEIAELNGMVYILNEPSELGTFVINTENWVQPQNDNEIIKVTSHIASVATNTLLKSQQMGKEKFNVIVYLEKFKVGHLNYKFIKYMTDILKQLFPERLNQATLIDPPRFFISGFDIIKKFLDKPTRRKVRMISTKDNKEVYFDELED